jgi:hypothetical protein
MTSSGLRLGAFYGHPDRDFRFPLDFAAQKFAVTGVSGSGKTCVGYVLAEELYDAQLPCTIFDPAGNFWGLRATVDGQPSHRKIVVIGGRHGDLPLERDAGAKIAEAIINANVFSVIDFSTESKTTYRKFVTEFVEQLMQMPLEIPRQIFFEEAKELVPQKPVGNDMKRCYAAVEKFIIQGRNFGYGFTLFGQRPATINKDALSQCENVIVLRTSGKHDRKAYKEWFEGKSEGLGEEIVGNHLRMLPELENGEALLWSPQWLKAFERLKVRPRTCFHPGETRKIGQAFKKAELADVEAFVSKLKRELAKKTVAVEAPVKAEITLTQNARAIDRSEEKHKEVEALRAALSTSKVRSDNLEAENKELRRRIGDIETAWRKERESVRKALHPLYQSLRTVFEEINSMSVSDDVSTVYAPWLDRAGRGGRRKMLEVLIDKRELTRNQLATLATISFRSRAFRDYLSWLRRNGLISTAGEMVKLEVPA